VTPDKVTFQYVKEGMTPLQVPYSSILKHQVSPASHSKALLKFNLNDEKSLTFRLPNRNDLERIRKDMTKRLTAFKNGIDKASSQDDHRRHADLTAAKFGDMDPTASAVTRSSLLAANPTLRAQHYYLVTETSTMSEDDFWKTHQSLVEEEYAKICGQCKTGPSSIIQSHLVTAQGGIRSLWVSKKCDRYLSSTLQCTRPMKRKSLLNCQTNNFGENI
jgi:hypothetical protein